MTYNEFDNYRFSKDTRLKYEEKLYFIKEINFYDRTFRLKSREIRYKIPWNQVEVYEEPVFSETVR